MVDVVVEREIPRNRFQWSLLDDELKARIGVLRQGTIQGPARVGFTWYTHRSFSWWDQVRRLPELWGRILNILEFCLDKTADVGVDQSRLIRINSSELPRLVVSVRT